MTNTQFAQNLDCCFAQLNQVTVETVITVNGIQTTVKPKEVTSEDIQRCKEGLLVLLQECKQRGWLPSQEELDELYKDSPDNYQYNWQYLNNQ